MARRSTAASKSSPEDRLVDAALAMIADTGWKNLSLLALGRQAGLSPAELHSLCPGKQALLALITKRIDIAMLGNLPDIDPDTPLRDRAFDAILNWFEAMAPMRDALEVIHAEGAADYGMIIDAMPATMRSAHWIAEVATVPTTGWQGYLATRAIGLLLAETMGVWIADGDDLAKTMAHVDRRLRMIETWAENLKQTGKRDEEDDLSLD